MRKPASKPARKVEQALEIEDGMPADLPAIIDIDSRITGIAKPELWRRLVATEDGSGEGGVKSRSFLVARMNGQVVGYVAGEIRGWEFGTPPSGWLITIGVRPDYRLGRIGSALFAALQARFRAQGVATFRTLLQIDDNLLLSFFRAQGLTAGPILQLEMPLDPA